MKRCCHCKQSLDDSFFYNRKLSADGLQSMCKKCKVLVKYNHKYINHRRIGTNIKCSVCGEIKHETLFVRDSQYICGFEHRCKLCSKERNRKNYISKDMQHTRAMKRQGYIYILKCEDYYKIGKTTQHIKDRLVSINTGNPFEIKVIYLVENDDIDNTEYELHSIFHSKRYKLERFHLLDSDIDKIKNILQHNLNKGN